MNWPKKLWTFSFCVLIYGLQGCGVKGDPIPPDKPAEIGRGRPTYKRATEGIRIQRSTPSVVEEEDSDDERE